MKPTLLVQGMHGMGDCLHQRAILRQLMLTYTVTLETSWASMYHDLIEEGLIIVRRPVGLRTQTKNAIREARLFSPVANEYPLSIRTRYMAAEVQASASKTVLEAMCKSADVDYASADYSLPVPDEWFEKVETIWRAAEESGKPVMIYRPLVSRPEWKGSAVRNADPDSYAALLASIRDEFYVISIADLEPGREWTVGPQPQADATFHEGELHFEMLAALFSLADLVFTSSGFPTVLAPAVSTPVVNIVGGYESCVALSTAAKYAPYLGIEPAQPCSCMNSYCRQQAHCDKTLRVTAEIPRLRKFVSEICRTLSDKDWSTVPLPAVKFAPPTLTQTAPPARPFPAPPRQSQAYITYLQQQRRKVYADAVARGEKA